MENVIIIAILIAIISASVRYLYKRRKSGAACIGCPAGGKCTCGCCGSETDSQDRLKK